MYKVIFESCVRVRYPQDFEIFDSMLPLAKLSALTVNDQKISGKDKAFSIRYLLARDNSVALRTLTIDDNNKYVGPALEKEGLEYAIIQPQNPGPACEHLLNHLMTEEDCARAEEIVASGPGRALACKSTLFSSTNMMLGAAVCAVAVVGSMVYRSQKNLIINEV